jgi:6-pyruvoyltetrahydropterin/6-carboxytetrahydropterin synthase
MRICREFYFDSSHYLPKYKGKCETLHGHTYKLEVVLEGDVKADGMVLDFTKVKEIVDDEVLEVLDHRILNDFVKNPTAEHIVEWIWDKLMDKMPLYSIRLWEGHGKWAEKTI